MEIGELIKSLNQFVARYPEAEKGEIAISIPGKGITYEEIKRLPESGGWYDFEIEADEATEPNALIRLKGTAIMV